MLGLCVLITFELTVLVALVALGLFHFKKREEEAAAKEDERWVILFAWLDRYDRNSVELKALIEAKFGTDLVEKINAILKLGTNPGKLVVGKDKKLHKVNREY